MKHFIENQTFNTSVLRQTYLPIERDWMVGTKVPESYWGEREADRSDGLMYKSFLGNQYGACRIQEFEPSISTWISNSTKKNNDYEGILSPTLRLILRLAQTNQTLCYKNLKCNLIQQREFTPPGKESIRSSIRCQKFPFITICFVIC